MSTSIKAFEEFEQKAGERYMEARMRHFFEQWQPEDANLTHEFYADFHMLVRSIYADACKPTNAMMSAIQSAMPIIFPVKAA